MFSLRFNSVLGILAIAGLLFSGCKKQEPDPTPAPGPSTVAVTGITVGSASLSLTEGGTGTISYSIAPSNATNQGVSFKSSDSSVASVDSNGKVTAGKPGTASITVTTADGGKTATCTVTVTAKNVAVTGLTLNKSKVSLTVGETFKIEPEITPKDATNKEVEWKSSNTAVATVANDGTVTAVKAGTATITCTTKDGGKKATCAIEVQAAAVAVTGLTLNKSTLSIVVEETFKLVPTIKPDNATNKEVEWKSSNTAVATVAEDGTVTAVKAGTATITCTTKDGGKKATCAVTVTAKAVAVTGVTLNKSSLSITAGETFKLVPTIKPDNATNKEVEWKSSNTAVATVANDGTITAVKAGNATITCTAKDGSNKKATCAVTVKAATVAVTGVELKSTLTMNIGGTYTLTATVKPENATNKNVTWKTSDASIVTVSEGKLTALKKGTATITVTTKDGSKTATCKVTVKDIRWFQTQGGSSSYSLGAGGANPEPQTFTYIMGSNTGTLGDAMKFYLNDGSGSTYTDSDESHWKYQVLSNDGCIEGKVTKESSRYTYTVTFKKNGHAKVRLSYDNGEFSLTQDVNFDIYLDGSGKWKFQYRLNSGSWKDYPGGNLTAKLSDKNYSFKVVTTSGGAISDIDTSHYRIYDWWPDAKVITTSVNQQTVSGNNYCVMWALFQKADYTFVELSYTDGTYMLACEHFKITVTN